MSEREVVRPKRLLVILASPRKQGTIANMLHFALDKAKYQGYETEFVDLYEKNVALCKGCMACKSTGVCVIDDDISAIRQSLLCCKLLLVGCPTYFANVTAPLKNMFDRLVSTLIDDNCGGIPKPKLLRKQQYILMTACNTPFLFNRMAGQSTGCLKAMNEALHISGMTCVGKVAFAGTRGKTELPKSLKGKIERCFT